jgi:hypothetical protein
MPLMLAVFPLLAHQGVAPVEVVTGYKLQKKFRPEVSRIANGRELSSPAVDPDQPHASTESGPSLYGRKWHGAYRAAFIYRITSLDHFVRAQQHRLRDRDANLSRRFQVHGQLHPAE